MTFNNFTYNLSNTNGCVRELHSSSLPLSPIRDKGVGATGSVYPKDKITKYLLGNNPNLIGTIIAIRKSLKRNNLDKYMTDVANEPYEKHYVTVCYIIIFRSQIR